MPQLFAALGRFHLAVNSLSKDSCVSDLIVNNQTIRFQSNPLILLYQDTYHHEELDRDALHSKPLLEDRSYTPNSYVS